MKQNEIEKNKIIIHEKQKGTAKKKSKKQKLNTNHASKNQIQKHPINICYTKTKEST